MRRSESLFTWEAQSSKGASPLCPYGARLEQCPAPRESAQALIIALLVLFVLAFLGVLFIGLIARNIVFTQRGRESLNEQYFAEAGIRFVVDQLRFSEEGADWRPEPDNLPIAQKQDPDYRWLRPYANTERVIGNYEAGPSGGFTRIQFGKGRALIRLTYLPNRRDPFSHFLKIESIGRVGEVNPNDPTTLIEEGPPRRRVLVAYVQIGILDYLRFVMNHNRRSTPIEFGAQELGLLDPNGNPVKPRTILGDPDVNTPNRVVGGAPIRINGDLKWYGKVELWLHEDTERFEVAGDILHDPAAEVLVNGTRVLPSKDPNFTTLGGLYRDGRPNTAVDGHPRSIAYIEPPRMDMVDPATSQMRYRALTRDSGKWRQASNGSWFNTGQFGYGRGIYLNNPQDIQQESETLIGGYSLRNEWLNPGRSAYWNGPFYEPPGAYIELMNDLPNSRVGFYITRNQSRPADIWRDPFTGQPTNRKTLGFFFRDPNNRTNPNLYNEFTRGNPNEDVAFNGVIYAEGNVRVRGVIPAGRQITIVTNGTAYIEGNILKGDEYSALAILARDYVCLNTTQFVRRALWSPASAITDPLDSDAPFHFDVGPNNPLGLQFSFGVDPTNYLSDSRTGGVRLFLRHAAQDVASYINLLVNPGTNANVGGDFYLFNLTGFPPEVYALQNRGLQVYPRYERTMFTLLPPPNNATYTLFGNPGVENLLIARLDQSLVPPPGNRNYYFSVAAIQPLDIKIQAVLYAQNGSFFVIPGYWLNTNPDDNRRNYQQRGARPQGAIAPEFPFYGDPLDIRITIEGAICENLPASLNDQTEWLRHWGWIPRSYGSSSYEIPALHRDFGNQRDYYFHDRESPNPQYAINLLLRYDPHLRYPFDNSDPPQPLRKASFTDPSGEHPGRILPLLPRMPVCPKPIYVGELRP